MARQIPMNPEPFLKSERFDRKGHEGEAKEVVQRCVNEPPVGQHRGVHRQDTHEQPGGDVGAGEQRYLTSGGSSIIELKRHLASRGS